MRFEEFTQESLMPKINFLRQTVTCRADTDRQTHRQTDKETHWNRQKQAHRKSDRITLF